MLSVQFNDYGDIKLGWHGRSLILIEPAPCLVEACRLPEAEPLLAIVADRMADIMEPSIPAAYVEGVLRKQGVIDN